MTFGKAKTRLAEICAGIVQQNRELMEKMDEPDFDPGIGFDNTKNNAGYMLTDFFDVMKTFPYGNVPAEVADDVVSTTDALLAKMREKYGRSEAVLRELIGVGQAFRDSKRIWRIKNPVVDREPAVYAAQLDSALQRILRALDDLNYELNLLAFKPPPEEEALKYVQVVQLVTQAKSLKKQSDLSEKLDKNTERILKAIRSEGEKPFDKRSPQERRLIDLAAIHYARRRYLDGLDIPKSDCIRHVWEKYGDTKTFRGYDAFANAVRYDLDRYYNLDVLIARAKTERVPPHHSHFL